ncbi:MAG: ankyrin repeat domain-containing protein [Alphaproteobacteria bacterium]|nr:ankyrin repeat domain-containing protein [Alphaproteobacteria bacterium]
MTEKSESQQRLNLKLLRAVDESHDEKHARLLIDSGADVNAYNGEILFSAADCALAGTVEYLLQAGADVNARYDGQAPLHAAARHTRVCSPRWGGEYVYTGKVSTVKKLIKWGADVNVVDTHGETPLHYAARAGFGRVVSLLLRAGADPGVADKRGNTPGITAAIAGHKKISERLAKAEGRPKPAPQVRVPPKMRRKPVKPKPAVRPVVKSTTENEINPQWIRRGDKAVACVENCPELNRKVTMLFNFAVGQCVTITENLETGQEAVCNTALSAMGAKAVKEAGDMLIANGGDEGVVTPHVPVLRPRLIPLPKGGAV